MCGIAGCVGRGPAEANMDALQRMVRSLAHRGPDDRDIKIIDNVGLAHTRLAIVGLGPPGHQPMADRSGRWWLCYNGEVYNHAELRSALPPRPYRGSSDTETLVEALAEWDSDALPRCNGIFAFAALDTVGRRLLLVRDRFGVKPLYFAEHAGTVWFASELRTLLAAGVPATVDVDSLEHAIQRRWVSSRDTPLAGVKQLLPGEMMSVDLDTLEITSTRWYRLGESVDPARSRELAGRSRSAAADAVEAALRSAVSKRLMADVPVGTTCSGGIDSSLVTAYAREEYPDLVAFNARVIDEPEQDEGEWASYVASHLGVPLHTVNMTADMWREGLVRAVTHYELPLTHEASVPLAMIAEMARGAGVKVLLSGEGADELFGGYTWHHQNEYADFRRRHEHLKPALREVYRALQRRGLRPDRFPEPRLGPSRSVYEHETEMLKEGLAAYSHHRGVRRRLEAKLLAELATTFPQILARLDKNTMQHSIETREPFLDRSVVELALNLPLEHRVEPSVKALLRDLAERRLPDGVAARRKVGFNFDVQHYLKAAARPAFLDQGLLREVVRASSGAWHERIASASRNTTLLMWSAEIWCRTMLRGDTVDTIEDELWQDLDGIRRRAGATERFSYAE